MNKLIEEIADEYLPDIHVNGMDCPDHERAKEIAEMCRKVAVEAAKGNKREGMGWEFNAAIDESIEAINKAFNVQGE